MIEMINRGPHSKHRERLNDGVMEWECEECGEWKARSPHYSNSGRNDIRHVCKPCRGEGTPRVTNTKGREAHAEYIRKMQEVNKELSDARQAYYTTVDQLKEKKATIYNEYLEACKK